METANPNYEARLLEFKEMIAKVSCSVKDQTINELQSNISKYEEPLDEDELHNLAKSRGLNIEEYCKEEIDYNKACLDYIMRDPYNWQVALFSDIRISPDLIKEKKKELLSDYLNEADNFLMEILTGGFSKMTVAKARVKGCSNLDLVHAHHNLLKKSITELTNSKF